MSPFVVALEDAVSPLLTSLLPCHRVRHLRPLTFDLGPHFNFAYHFSNFVFIIAIKVTIAISKLVLNFGKYADLNLICYCFALVC